MVLQSYCWKTQFNKEAGQKPWYKVTICSYCATELLLKNQTITMLISTSIILSLDSVRVALSDPQLNMIPIYLLVALGSAFQFPASFL